MGIELVFICFHIPNVNIIQQQLGDSTGCLAKFIKWRFEALRPWTHRTVGYEKCQRLEISISYPIGSMVLVYMLT